MKNFISLFLVCAIIIASIQAQWIKIDPKTQHYIDENGRTVVFHGVNVVYKPEPFYPPILEPATAFDAWTSFTELDMRNLKNWGFNVIRLYVAWKGVQPTRNGPYNMKYLETIMGIVQNCKKYGIYVLLDMHQDLGHERYCGEGFPDWAVEKSQTTHGFPWPLKANITFDPVTGYATRESCTKHPFFEFYLTKKVGLAFKDLYTNADGIQDEFVKFWGVVASYFKDEPYVLGYDFLNEPWIGDLLGDPTLAWPGKVDSEYLAPMYKRIRDSIRNAGDHKHILFYEPCVFTTTNMGFKTGPGGVEENDRQAISYHIYCGSEGGKPKPGIKFVCDLQDEGIFWARDKDHKRIGGGRMLTEFGADADTKKDDEQLAWFLQQTDKRILSWTYWQFKSFGDFTTQTQTGQGFYDQKTGLLQAQKVKELARPYAPVVCGIPLKTSFSVKTAEFDLVFNSTTCGNAEGEEEGTTKIYMNYDYYAAKGAQIEVSPREAVLMMKRSVDMNWVTLKIRPEYQKGQPIHVKITQKQT